MSEFEGLDESNEVVNRNSLYKWTDRFPPRPLFIQTGYADQRVGQDRIWGLINSLREAYDREAVPYNFTHDLMNIPGHDGMRIPDLALDTVVTWLKQQSLL